MRHCFIFITTLTVSINCLAVNWEKVNDNNEFIGYIDTDSIQHSGSIVTYWLLYNFKNPQITNTSAIPYKSTKTKNVINCHTQETALEYGVMYSEKMGNGKLIHQTKLSRTFEPIIPETASQAQAIYLCNRIKPD
jgi:hypothetical protein